MNDTADAGERETPVIETRGHPDELTAAPCLFIAPAG